MAQLAKLGHKTRKVCNNVEETGMALKKVDELLFAELSHVWPK